MTTMEKAGISFGAIASMLGVMAFLWNIATGINEMQFIQKQDSELLHGRTHTFLVIQDTQRQIQDKQKVIKTEIANIRYEDLSLVYINKNHIIVETGAGSQLKIPMERVQ